jgi:hypothetical protein
VTLKSIAQNPEIREGMTRAEIDAAIARNADTEILFDRPYADPKVVRVAGPFTVESLSPHRVVADGPEDLIDPPAPIEDSGRFVETILDNLRSSGVDNRVKGERLRFETLDPFPGRFLQATGTFCEGDATRRVAVAIGPQYGTVGPDLVREAALEAGGYFDVLVVCGFAFDARADEETGKAMRFGKLTVLTARMNPDLAMADELLKKTRSGNLFTVFGQPDIDIRPVAGEVGQLQVEIHGLDVYDPTTEDRRPRSWRTRVASRTIRRILGRLASGFARRRPEVDPALRRVAVDLGKLSRGELEVPERGEVLLELDHAARSDDRRGHTRVAECPGERHLRQALSSTFRDLGERTHLGQGVVAEERRREGATRRGTRAGGDAAKVLAGQQPLRQRREDDAADPFFA